MPIYEYRCSNCGFEKEYLRRLSDPPLSDCPQCSKATFSKKVTAAGFQLKGGGWYATDFKGSPKPPASQSEGKGDSTSDGSATSKESSVNKEPAGGKEASASKDSSSSKVSADTSSSASKEPSGTKQTSGRKASAGSKEPA
jgi:putative FmdB family regulatory protein